MKELLLKASKDAGKLLMRHYGRIKYVREKRQKSYFTNVDIESEKLIISAIRKKFPKHNIISEETGKIDNGSDYTWYIDPVDGTHNYIHTLPMFGVSIALAHKGQVILGIINLPYFNETYFAEKGKGAFLNGKRMKVSRQKDAKRAFVVTDLALRYHPDEKIKALRSLKGKVYDIRVLGCAVYAHTLVAKGAVDAYFTLHTHSWDVAAGALIVEEAGGRVTGIDGSKWNLGQSQFAMSNGKVHKEILRIINCVPKIQDKKRDLS